MTELIGNSCVPPSESGNSVRNIAANATMINRYMKLLRIHLVPNVQLAPDQNPT